MQREHAVGVARGERVVADEHDRDVALAAELAQQLEHFAAALGVEAAGGLVGEQQARLGGERAGDHHPLALAHRQRLGAVGQALAEPEALQQRRDLAVRLAPAHGLQELQHGVVDRGDAGQQVEVLADEAQLGEAEVGGLALGQRGDVAAGDRHGAARRLQAASRPSAAASSCRSRSGRTGRPSPRVDRQRDAVDGADRLAANRRVVLDEVTQLQHLPWLPVCAVCQPSGEAPRLEQHEREGHEWADGARGRSAVAASVWGDGLGLER